MVFAVVRRLAGNEFTARDWEQEAWISVFGALRQFRGGAKLSSWIHRVAVNAVLQGRRREARHAHEPEQSGFEHPAPNAPTDDQMLLGITLEDALDRVPPGMREVLLLHDVHGYRHEEIAAMLDITDGASRSQLFKGRARLRELLRDDLVFQREGK